MKKIFYLTVVGFVCVLSACHKSAPTPPITSDSPGSALDFIKDSVFLYSQEAYYWADALPDYATLQPRSFTGSDDLDALSNEVDFISQYEINPVTGYPYEYYTPSPGYAKYSYIDNGATVTALAGTYTGFGFGLALNSNSNTDLRVRYVYAGSPAAAAGMHRGDQINGMNGRTGLDLSVSADYNFVVAAVNATPLTLTLTRPDNSTYTATLNLSTYTLNPVLLSKVIDLGGGKKVGYMVMNSLTALSNSQAAIDAAFASFTSSSITDLVVDFRYSDNGYLSTAQYLDNLIVPTAKTGTLMYNTYYNATLVAGKEQLLKNKYFRDANNVLRNYGQLDYSVAANAVNFAKKGSLNLSRVFFIVGDNTAAAAELVMNNLRPEMNVQFIGSNTFGMPVGYFPLTFSQYQYYMVGFETKNAATQGGYYLGMTPGSSDFPGVNDNDDVTKDFGDVTEGLLAHALNFVKNGSYSVGLKVQSTTGSGRTSNINFDKTRRKGMILDTK